MLVLFHSKSAAEILMYGQHALTILQAAGKTFEGGLPERGVITRAQLDAAIAGIEHAVAADTSSDASDHDGEHDDATEHPIVQSVGFRRRAWPLLAMLRLARDKGEDVTWEPAPLW